MVILPWVSTVLQRDMNIRQERWTSGRQSGVCQFVGISSPSKGFTHDKREKDPMAPAHPLRATGISSRLSQSCSLINWCWGPICGNCLINSFMEQTAEIEREREERVKRGDLKQGKMQQEESMSSFVLPWASAGASHCPTPSHLFPCGPTSGILRNCSMLSTQPSRFTTSAATKSGHCDGNSQHSGKAEDEHVLG